jgi:hypothetical protein
MNDVDVVVSINVYKFPKFLLRQLATIQENLLCSYVVILSCNDHMKHALLEIKMPNNIYINPTVINKKWFHGTVTAGIVSNIEYAINNFTFKHFIILSGRTVFYKQVSLNNLDSLVKKWNNAEEMDTITKGSFTDNDWHWPSFRRTLLAKHYLDLGYRLYGRSEHEGLGFSFQVTKTIYTFVLSNPKLFEDLFDFNSCVEEFSLQTIASNEMSVESLEYGYYNLGHGVSNCWDDTAENKYTKKIDYTED